MALVADFYAGKSVFVTGVTGFLGKVLIHRLLVCCPDVDKIYVLIRPRPEATAQDRLAKLLGSVAFENLARNHRDRLQKVVAVSGDIVGPDLGMRQEDLDQFHESIAVVFHTAATVKFDEALKTSVEVNVCGTKKLLSLCNNMRNLQAFVHVSTAYANCHRKKIEEVIYKPVICPDQLIRALEWMDDDMVKTITPTLIPPWPNTYTYAKALAEAVIAKEETKFAVGIVRPSIIGAAVKHPYPGYIDNYNGPSGLLAAIGKGALRIMLGNKSAVADVVPVDSVADFLITVPWHLANQPTVSKEVLVFNFVSGPVNPITWEFVQTSAVNCYMKNPVENLYRIPNAQFTSNRIICKFWTLVDHLLPAYLLDFVSVVQGKKPTVLASYRKLHKAMLCLDYFTQNNWEFDNDNVSALWKSIPVSDRKMLNFDLSSLNWKNYMEQFCLGVKVYLLRESTDTLPKARQALARRKSLVRIVTGVLGVLFLMVMSRQTHLLRKTCMVTLSIVVRLMLLMSKVFRS